MSAATFQGDVNTLLAAALEGKRNERELRVCIRQAATLIHDALYETGCSADPKLTAWLALPAVQSALMLEAADQGGAMTDDAKPLGASIDEFMQGLDDYVELEPDAVNSETQLILNWGRKGFGFGQLSFFERDGALVCDNECLSREFCNGVLEQFTATMSSGDLPPLMRRFQTIGALLDACTPTSPGPDWPAPKEKP